MGQCFGSDSRAAVAHGQLQMSVEQTAVQFHARSRGTVFNRVGKQVGDDALERIRQRVAAQTGRNISYDLHIFCDGQRIGQRGALFEQSRNVSANQLCCIQRAIAANLAGSSIHSILAATRLTVPGGICLSPLRG